MSSHYGKTAVRSSLLHFLFGKAINAVVSVTTLIVLARWLDPGAYGVYVALLAAQASLLAISSMGIETTAERFMPEIRTRHGDKGLLGYALTGFLARVLTLIGLAVAAALGAKFIAGLIGLNGYVAEFRLWAAVMVGAGVLSFIVILLEAMLLQRFAQRCMTIYVVARLLLLIALYKAGSLDLKTLIWIEFSANTLAALAGGWMFLTCVPLGGMQNGLALIRLYRQRMLRFAFFNYVAQVTFQLFNAEVMKLLVTRLLGVLQSARYGFALGVVETVQRYLPAVLLLRLIKPVFVSRYTQSGDFAQLNGMARLILKLNLLVLFPAITLAAVYGSELLALLSGGKYGDAQWILVGGLVLLIPSSHQLVLSILAGTLEKNSMQLVAGLASTVAFPCALLLIPDMGPMGAIASSFVSGLVYNCVATAYLRRSGFDYRIDVRGGCVFVVSGGLMGCVVLLVDSLLGGVAGFALATICGLAVYLGLVRFCCAFEDSERSMLNSVLPKRLFIL